MKLFILSVFMVTCACLAATIPAPVKQTTNFPTVAASVAGAGASSRFDITALLPSGAATGATGENAVSAVADEDSGAVGAKGENAVFGMSAPGMAGGFGTNLQGFNSLFSSQNDQQSDPAATPAAATNNNFFSFFN